jgi:hypothetical protein
MAKPPVNKRLLIISLLLSALLLTWVNPFAQRQPVDPGNWELLIPSEKTDDRVACMDGNNNLDVVRFNGRFYIGFRTAPSHFASDKTKLYIISSSDLEYWDYEHEIHLGKTYIYSTILDMDSIIENHQEKNYE